MIELALIIFTPLLGLIGFGLYLCLVIDRPEKTDPSDRIMTYRELNAEAKYLKDSPLK